MPTEDREEKLLKEFFRKPKRKRSRRTLNCPGEGRLAAFVDQTLDEDSRKAVEEHLGACRYCLDQVAFLLKSADLSGQPTAPVSLVDRARRFERSTSRVPFFRYGIPALAAVLLLALSVVLWFPFPSQTPEHPSFQTERSGSNLEEFRILSPQPESRVNALPFEVRWESVAGAFSYELRIATLGGELLWQGQTEETELQVPKDAALENGLEYFVYVRAQLPAGRVIRSAMLRFRLGPTGN